MSLSTVILITDKNNNISLTYLKNAISPSNSPTTSLTITSTKTFTSTSTSTSTKTAS